jgi:hypothetical protein
LRTAGSRNKCERKTVLELRSAWLRLSPLRRQAERVSGRPEVPHLARLDPSRLRLLVGDLDHGSRAATARWRARQCASRPPRSRRSGVSCRRMGNARVDHIRKGEAFSELAEECTRLAVIQTAPMLKGHYEKIAAHYLDLADAELRPAEEQRDRVSKKAGRPRPPTKTRADWRIAVRLTAPLRHRRKLSFSDPRSDRRMAVRKGATRGRTRLPLGRGPAFERLYHRRDRGTVKGARIA